MPLSDYQIALPNATIGPGTDHILVEWSGYGVPSFRTSDDAAPQDDGVWTGPDYLDGRLLVLTTVTRGDTPAEAVQNAEALLGAWYLDVSTDGYGSRMPLRLKMPGIDERVIFGRPRRADLATRRIIGTNVPGTWEFFCPDPLWYSSVEHQQVFNLSEPPSGRGYNRAYSYGYGGATDSGIYALVNAGTRATAPHARIVGPVVNPVIENIDTGERLRFQITLGPADWLDIDFKAKTVMLNGTATRYNTKSGLWFKLHPGSTDVRFTSDSYSSAASMTFTWRDAWA